MKDDGDAGCTSARNLNLRLRALRVPAMGIDCLQHGQAEEQSGAWMV